MAVVIERNSLLLLMLLASVLHVSAETFVIVVDSSSGRDNQTCLDGTGDTFCETLNYALAGAVHKRQDITVVLRSGEYRLNSSQGTVFDRVTGFTLRGDPEASVICDSNVGLTFFNSTLLAFQDISFIACGALQNSTSVNHVPQSGHKFSDTDLPFFQYHVALYFLLCADITMMRVNVSDSNGSGVALYSTGGHNAFSDCWFSRNNPDSHGIGGGGLSIEFAYCLPGDVDCFENGNSPSKYDPRYFQNVTYFLTLCRFVDNVASIPDSASTAYVWPMSNENIAIGRGGGLAVWFKGSSLNNNVTVTNCNFSGNQALWGGGLLLEFEDSVRNNLVRFTGSVFEENRVHYNACSYEGAGGGGVRLLFSGGTDSSNVHNNSVIMEDCHFNKNSAYFGGGISIAIFPESNSLVSNNLEFHSCSWRENVARMGSAIDLYVWHYSTPGMIIKPAFYSCEFVRNSIEYTNLPGTAAGIGTVYSDSVPLLFCQSITMMDNNGTPLVGLDAGIFFNESTTAVLVNNQGDYGGGIALYNQAFIQVGQNVYLNFSRNNATRMGGAIYWEALGNNQVVNSFCFIRFSNLSGQSFIFHNNTALLSGHAIFATTLVSCRWGGELPFGKPVQPRKYEDVFCNGSMNNVIWDYGSSNCSASIATAPRSFTTGATCGEGYTMSVYPGEFKPLPVAMLDDRNRAISSQSLVFLLSNQNRSQPSETRFISQLEMELKGPLDSTLDYNIETLQPRIVASHVRVTFKSTCPSGYFMFDNGTTCQLANYRYLQAKDLQTFNASILRGFWMGSYEKKVVTSGCLFCPWNANLDNKDYVPIEKEVEALDEQLCLPLNRTGVICVECINGTAAAVNSKSYSCLECAQNHTYYSWALYLASEFLPTTLLVIVIMVFNISTTSGAGNAFIFFAQIITVTFGVNAERTIDYSSLQKFDRQIEQVYTGFYDIWNLNFLDSIDGTEFCLSTALTALEIKALDYLVAFYPLMIIALASLVIALYERNTLCIVAIFRPLHQLLARFRRKWNINRSLGDAFATFFVLSFTKFTVVSCVLLYPHPLYDENGSCYHLISGLNGELYFSWKYAPYLAGALLVSLLVCVLVPLLLLLYSLPSFYSLLGKTRLQFLLPGIKFQHFLNAFYNCYKDGSDGSQNCRFFASVYFFLRVVLMASYAFCPRWMQQYVIQQVVCTFAILLFVVIQPYKERLYNCIDATMFGLLATINILTVFNHFLQVSNEDLSHTTYYTQLVLIFIPLLAMIFYILFYIIKTNKEFLVCCCRRKKGAGNTTQQFEASFGTYIDTVANGGHWDQTFYYGPVQNEMGSTPVGHRDGPVQTFTHNTVGFENSENEDDARETDPLLPVIYEQD